MYVYIQKAYLLFEYVKLDLFDSLDYISLNYNIKFWDSTQTIYFQIHNIVKRNQKNKRRKFLGSNEEKHLVWERIKQKNLYTLFGLWREGWNPLMSGDDEENGFLSY